MFSIVVWQKGTFFKYNSFRLQKKEMADATLRKCGFFISMPESRRDYPDDYAECSNQRDDLAGISDQNKHNPSQYFSEDKRSLRSEF